jgi:CheY-like chemotaxis protein
MKRLRILLIEDDHMCGLLTAEMLESMGHLVCAVVVTEAQAVSATMLSKPDLLVVDAKLDHGSGIHAVQTIMRMRRIPHFFITGDAALVTAFLPEALIVQKPFHEVDLALAIMRSINREVVS